MSNADYPTHPDPMKDFPHNPYCRLNRKDSAQNSVLASAYEIRTANLLNLIPYVEEKERGAIIEEVRKRVGLDHVCEENEEKLRKEQEPWEKL